MFGYRGFATPSIFTALTVCHVVPCLLEMLRKVAYGWLWLALAGPGYPWLALAGSGCLWLVLAGSSVFWMALGDSAV